jgi:DNA-binding transcriptional regulator YhcF (GntR family)
VQMSPRLSRCPMCRFPDIDQDQPTAQQIHAAMKSAILSLALPPGTRLSEAETGARFGASRTPVREAMTWLRDEGLIVTMPSKGEFRHLRCPRMASAARSSSARRWKSPPSSGSARPACRRGRRAAQRCDHGPAQRDLVRGSRRLLRRRRRVSCCPCRGHGPAAGPNAGDAGEDGARPAARAADERHGLPAQLEDEHKRILNTLRKGRLDRAQRIMQRHLSRARCHGGTQGVPRRVFRMIRPCLPEVTGVGGRPLRRDPGSAHRFAPWPLRPGVVGQGHALPRPGGVA